MSINDSDLELLETLLDGELPEDETEVLQRRMIFEPALATAMQTLQSERLLRMKVWQAMEPTAAAMSRVEAHVDRKVHGHLQWSRALSRLRLVSAAAACIVVGVMVGKFGTAGNGGNVGALQASKPNPGVTAVAGAGKTVQVPIVDEYKNVVDVVTLTPEEANEMTSDFSRENDRQKNPNGGTVLIEAPAEGKF